MFTRKIPFIIPLKREATSTTTFTAKTAPWHPKDVVTVDAVSVSVDAHNDKTVHVGISRAGLAIYLETLILDVNEAFYCTKAPIVIPSGYRVIVKCVSPTKGCNYSINVFGHIEICSEE